MKQRSVHQAFEIQYVGAPVVNVYVDGAQSYSSNITLPNHPHPATRRVTLPHSQVGYFAEFKSYSPITVTPVGFESVPLSQYQNQQLFHYIEFAYRGDVNFQIYADRAVQTQTKTYSIDAAVDTRRIYFDALAFGYVPHLYCDPSSTGEVLWSKPVALPPRFFRGVRTHAEFQINFIGDVTLRWYLDGEAIGDWEFSSTTTTTEKTYFPSSTTGYILQYRHIAGDGRVYTVETDITLADMEQQTMTEGV